MSPVDLFRVSWLGVRRRVLRSALTAASLLFGVLTIVLVQGSGTLIQAATVQRAILSSGPRTTLLVPLNVGGGSLVDEQTAWQAQLRAITNDVDGRVAQYNQYPSATLLSREMQTLESPELVGVSSNMRAVRPFRIIHGTWFEGQTLVPQLVLNESAWAALRSPLAPVWMASREGFERLQVKIVGVVDDGTTSPAAYVNTAQTDALAAAGLFPAARSLLVSSTLTDEATLTNRIAMLATITGQSGEIGEIARIDQLDQYDSQLETTRRVFLAIGALCLLVGSLSILNIGLATLRERSEELSLRRSLGASRSQILTIMMLESQIVALSAAAGAIVLAYLAVPSFLKQLTSIHVESTALPVIAVILGVAASSLAALLGAIAPSIRAARVPIASIMR